ncbi:MAG TPA: hypothetical protein VF802_08335, partial [Candidatus Limnocylindrales bacterium]
MARPVARSRPTAARPPASARRTTPNGTVEAGPSDDPSAAVDVGGNVAPATLPGCAVGPGVVDVGHERTAGAKPVAKVVG